MTVDGNPWIARPVEPELVESLASTVSGPAVTGPLGPQVGIPAPDLAARLSVRPQPQPAQLWWLGTHGGAGESTLADLVPQWLPAEHAWPLPPGGAPARVVLTGRSNLRGLKAAQAAATQWAAGLVPHVELVGLVVVADAPGRIPRPLRDFAKVVGGGVPRTWTVPWIDAWRLGEPLTLPETPREVRRLIDDLHAVLRPAAAGTTYRKEHPC